MCDCKCKAAPTISEPPPYYGSGVDLEIWEAPPINKPGADRWIPIKPTRLKINGVEVLVPDEAPVQLNGLVDKHACATATITVFVNSLKVHGG